jgi:flagellar hook protein FlgE
MGLQGALYTGVSALSATGEAMNVIGNNLANSNTTAFKASRTLFSDLLANNVSSDTGNAQVGTGVGLASVDTVFSQGGFNPTESNTDLAIEGEGFFIVQDSATGSKAYTRAGGFKFSDDGYLINPQGYRVQGYTLDDDGNPVGTLDNIYANLNGSVAANKTGSATFNTNLNASATSLGTSGSIFSNADPAGTSSFSTSTNVYDSLGRAHLMNIYFSKTDTDNTWDYNIAVPQDDVQTGGSDGIKVVGSGALTFDSSGELTNITATAGTADGVSSGVASMTTSALDWDSGADDSQEIALNFGLSQYSGQSELVSKTQDGYNSGALNDIEVDQEGILVGSYSNGQTRELAQLGLAKFANNNGLAQIGNSMFESTNDSGLPSVGVPGSGVGSIRSNALEQSTVDIATEFTNMITTQRAYQANSRTITTTDEMLQEVVNLKR